jgi:hypothetical protein
MPYLLLLFVIMAEFSQALPEPFAVTIRRDDSLYSVPLKRSVRLDVILPPITTHPALFIQYYT